MSLINRLKQFKIAHWIYNLFHYKMLLHNRAAYRKYQIHKSLTSSISSKDFPDKESQAWLDKGNSADLVPKKAGFLSFPEKVQQQLLDWSDTGYLILPGLLDESTVQAVNDGIDRLLHRKKLHFTHDGKLMFANRKSSLIRSVAEDKKLTGILSFILDKDIRPFQTINFLKGSNQRAHSDSIHMTTYPLGYLVAAWIALEDTNMQNGPLFYYPGSHRLPYLLNEGFNEGATKFTLGKKDYPDYENALELLVSKGNFEKKVFLARAGDCFVWHANLVHGGLPVVNPSLTRKSMVIHYFAKDVIKYHEISERPSLLSKD
ncbi:MAG TPA: phytanoyl-CoA dioxygenase family protein [Puia sp.]|nr:phytanoyl-CoA dioxygenase family protein [Puia sp.]